MRAVARDAIKAKGTLPPLAGGWLEPAKPSVSGRTRGWVIGVLSLPHRCANGAPAAGKGSGPRGEMARDKYGKN